MLPVFFHPATTPDLTDLSFPRDKFAAMARSWPKRFPNVKLVKAEASSERELSRVHDEDHVRAMLAGDKRNGFGAIQRDTTESGAYDTGSFVAAALVAFQKGVNAASIGGMFAQAGYDRCHSSCSFNGYLVAAEMTRAAGFRSKIGIFDGSHHFGDGTFDIIAKLDLGDFVRHYSFGQYSFSESEIDAWLDEIPDILGEMADGGVRILYYGAGVDVHFQDPRTKGVMSRAQIQRRDQQVFNTCRKLKIPVAWTTGPGNLPVEALLTLHESTVLASLGSP